MAASIATPETKGDKKKRRQRSRSRSPEKLVKARKSRSRSRSCDRTRTQASKEDIPIYCHRCTKADPNGKYCTGWMYGGYCDACCDAMIANGCFRYDHNPTEQTLVNRASSLICWSCGSNKSKGIHVVASPHPGNWMALKKKMTTLIDGLHPRVHWLVTRHNDICLVTSDIRKKSQNCYACQDPKQWTTSDNYRLTRALGDHVLEELWGEQFDEKYYEMKAGEYQNLRNGHGISEINRVCAFVYGEALPVARSASNTSLPSTAAAASAASSASSSSSAVPK